MEVFLAVFAVGDVRGAVQRGPARPLLRTGQGTDAADQLGRDVPHPRVQQLGRHRLGQAPRLRNGTVGPGFGVTTH